MEYLNKSMELFIAYDEVDFTGRLKMSAIVQHYQNLLEKHARDLKISHKEMQDKGAFWILSRMKTVVDYYPKASSKITALTYPHKPGIVEATRSFYLMDEQGSIFAKTLSKWCILDIETRKICRCRDFITNPDNMFSPDKAVEFSARNFAQTVQNDEKINSVVEASKDFCVNISDLDINLHMNNAKYYDIILNMCSINELQNNEIASIDLSFLSELKYDDCFKVTRNDKGGVSKFEGTLQDKRIFSAQLEWRKTGLQGG